MRFFDFTSATGLSLSAILTVAAAHPFPGSGTSAQSGVGVSADLLKREETREDWNQLEVASEDERSPKRLKTSDGFNDPCLNVRNLATQGDVHTAVGLNAQDHALLASCLIRQGYKPLSLSSYGAPVEYSSIWAMEPHGTLRYIQHVNYATYSAWLQEGKDAGYMSTFVTVTGDSTETAIFSGVMEESSNQFWHQLCDIRDPGEIEHHTREYAYYLVDFAAYGAPTDRKYCILAHENSQNVPQSFFLSTANDPFEFSEYAEILREQTLKRFWQPTRQYLGENYHVSAFFQNDHLGRWEAFQNLERHQLDSKIEQMKAEGLGPIDIQGGGNPEKGIRYNVIFAERTTPKALEWTIVGETTGFEDNEGTTAKVDATIKDFMTANRVRQVQLAAAYKGTILMERAYTFGEDDYPVVSVDDPFMIASLSKLFCNAAIDVLIQQGLLTLDTRVYETLGYTHFADERSRDITVQHLIDHQGGFDRSVSIDPLFGFREIAEARKLNRAATLYDVIEYMIGQPLDLTPGTKEVYTNYGNMLLEYLITNITKTGYYDFLQTHVLGGEVVLPYATSYEAHLHENFIPESVGVGIDPRILDRKVRVPSAFGGDGAIREESLGTAGMATTASAIARFVGSHAVWTIGGHEYNDRGGLLAGSQAHISCRSDDLDLVILTNMRDLKSPVEWDYLIQNSLHKMFDGARWIET
ncbi:hypothetical protein BROUX41_002128 [Berkeleyomyces rouxiae]|uniref:uncharacterized protein n=1 Tax=Berkeleyomyces rouxiae TaxID=2035830 RepID=UPI003B7821BE